MVNMRFPFYLQVLRHKLTFFVTVNFPFNFVATARFLAFGLFVCNHKSILPTHFFKSTSDCCSICPAAFLSPEGEFVHVMVKNKILYILDWRGSSVFKNLYYSSRSTWIWFPVPTSDGLQ